MAQTALITGASRGIGREAALLLARQGMQIAVNYREQRGSADELVSLLHRQGADAIAIQADVADREQVNKMVHKIEQAFGGVDVLVHSAGIAQQKLFTDIVPKEWRRMFAVHVDGLYHCCQAVLPHMLHQKFGRIVAISSMWGEVGASCEVHYSAAKAAVIGMTKALAKELGPSGITVNCVSPGVIDTDMNALLTGETKAQLCEETPLCRIGTAREAAEAIAFLASDSAAFITGQVLGVNGGIVV